MSVKLQIIRKSIASLTTLKINPGPYMTNNEFDRIESICKERRDLTSVLEDIGADDDTRLVIGLVGANIVDVALSQQFSAEIRLEIARRIDHLDNQLIRP